MGVKEIWIKNINPVENESRLDYTCGHCNKSVSGRVVSLYRNDQVPSDIHIKFMICTSCEKGSIWLKSGKVIPGINPGDKLEGLPDEVNESYEEARKCFSVDAYTACELICRKILMHIAVDKGAKECETFQFYIDFLKQKEYITPSIKEWTDIIRKSGNDSTHKIEKPDKERAENTFMFTMQLLRIIYEMEHRAKRYVPTSPKTEEIPSSNKV